MMVSSIYTPAKPVWPAYIHPGVNHKQTDGCSPKGEPFHVGSDTLSIDTGCDGAQPSRTTNRTMVVGGARFAGLAVASPRRRVATVC